MINSYKKIVENIFAIVVISATASGMAYAQLGDAGAILRAGADDANLLMESYLAPFGKGFGADLNTGWFNTAQTHKTLGFDISINVAGAIVPTSDQVFNVDNLNFNELERLDGSAEAPTISGDEFSNTEMGITYTNPQTNQEETLTSFVIPGGTGFPYVPSPMIQASIGIIKDTDITVRFVPETDIDPIDGSVGLFGFGVKHGINQWLPGGGAIPVDLSVQFGYTSFNSNAGFDIDPESGTDIYNEYQASTWDDQGMELETSATTFNAIVGKTLPIISVYGGVGIESSTTTISSPGSYPITAPNENYNNAGDPSFGYPKVIERIDSPVDIEIEGDNSFRAFAGTRIKLAILQISASYTLSSYSSFNVGFGISFR
ncbi:MAG: DUF6588 family protein [Gracilimonas sp.]